MSGQRQGVTLAVVTAPDGSNARVLIVLDGTAQVEMPLADAESFGEALIDMVRQAEKVLMAWPNVGRT